MNDTAGLLGTARFPWLSWLQMPRNRIAMTSLPSLSASLTGVMTITKEAPPSCDCTLAWKASRDGTIVTIFFTAQYAYIPAPVFPH